jgi:uncharacterized phage protein (TIGR02220 family)
VAKRFTDSGKWSKPWFRALPPKYKCLWIYICDSCDIAGIIDVDFLLADFMIGEKLDPKEVEILFKKQIEKIGTKWRILDFIQFQYGTLKANNNFHIAVQSRLDGLAPHQPLISPCLGAMVKERVKEEVKDKTRELEILSYFNSILGKKFEMNPARLQIISSRLKEGRTVEEMKQAIDNFSKDTWEDRHKYCDIVFVIGVRNKVDNLDKWLLATPAKPKTGTYFESAPEPIK